MNETDNDIIYAGGTLGDAYVILLKLLYYDYREITHVDKNVHLFPKIKEIYSLKDDLIVNFEKRANHKKPRDHLQGRVDTVGEIVPFPKFDFPSIKKFDLPSEFNAVQFKSGTKKDWRFLNNTDFNKIDLDKPLVVLGVDDLKLNTSNMTMVDLRGKTTLLESFAIINKCNTFYGLNGVLSFVSLSLRKKTEIFIKHEIDRVGLGLRIDKIPEWHDYAKYINRDKIGKQKKQIEQQHAKQYFGF